MQRGLLHIYKWEAKAQKVKHASEREEGKDREGEVNTTGAVGSSLPAWKKVDGSLEGNNFLYPQYYIYIFDENNLELMTLKEISLTWFNLLYP